MSEFVDYYAVLQVSPEAEFEVIDKAYKALIFKYHPDRGGDEERAKKITTAFYALKDPARRKKFDQARSSVISNQQAKVTLDDIPAEVIDAIIWEHWKRGAAKAVAEQGKKAVNVVGSAAASAGTAIDQGAQTLWDGCKSDYVKRRVVGGLQFALVGVLALPLLAVAAFYGGIALVSALGWLIATPFQLASDGVPVWVLCAAPILLLAVVYGLFAWRKARSDAGPSEKARSGIRATPKVVGRWVRRREPREQERLERVLRGFFSRLGNEKPLSAMNPLLLPELYAERVRRAPKKGGMDLLTCLYDLYQETGNMECSFGRALDIIFCDSSTTALSELERFDNFLWGTAELHEFLADMRALRLDQATSAGYRT